ncbi:MAG: hypothetical protein ACRDRZ_03600 [Pseudonocardiaceae bacterium]
MPLVPFTAGQKLTAAELNAAFDIDRTVYQAADQTVTNSVTLVSSTSLTMPVEANATYAYDALVIYTAPTAQDFRYKWLLPTGSGIRNSPWNNTLTDTTLNAPVAHDAFDVFESAAGGIGAGAMVTYRPGGVMIVGATSGSMTFQFAQWTAGAATSAVLKLGSWVRLARVA